MPYQDSMVTKETQLDVKMSRFVRSSPLFFTEQPYEALLLHITVTIIKYSIRHGYPSVHSFVHQPLHPSWCFIVASAVDQQQQQQYYRGADVLFLLLVEEEEDSIRMLCSIPSTTVLLVLLQVLLLEEEQSAARVFGNQ